MLSRLVLSWSLPRSHHAVSIQSNLLALNSLSRYVSKYPITPPIFDLAHFFPSRSFLCHLSTLFNISAISLPTSFTFSLCHPLALLSRFPYILLKYLISIYLSFHTCIYDSDYFYLSIYLSIYLSLPANIINIPLSPFLSYSFFAPP